MYLVPFLSVEPGLAVKDARSVDLPAPRGRIPPGSYQLVESYCPDPDCDCRRVMINVVERKNPRRYLAAIGYGFDREDEFAGPYLDALNWQCAYAEDLLDLVQEIALDDSLYVARLKRHYAIVKRAALDPTHPAYDRLLEACEKEEEEEEEAVRVPGPEPRRVGRNDPCPCGSGKKFKRCCGRRNRKT